MTIQETALRAKAASNALSITSAAVRNAALFCMADALEEHAAYLLEQNALDVRAGQEKGMSAAFIDRLTLTPERISGMANGMRKVAALPDPIGSADHVMRRPNGLFIEKRRVPLGLIGVIYESRPNVTSDVVALCIKSGNCCILRGGSEAIRSNTAIADCIRKAAYQCGIPEGAIALINDTNRASATALMQMVGVIDVLIPRGGAGLIRSVVEQARVPVIETGAGVCHAYIDESADAEMAVSIVENAKCSRPSVCNAIETLLIHESVAKELLPRISERLSSRGVELRCDARAKAILPTAKDADESDWSTEYDDLILSVKVVESLDAAIRHIQAYGTHHSDVIITNRYDHAERFLNEVDSAAVYVNASTRFTDGEEFGLGAEIGISTQKLHARGPMGLDALTTVKYVVRGDGQIR